MSALVWRYFRIRELREAYLCASGGIAVHDNEGAFPYRGRRTYRDTAHLFAIDAAALIAAGVEVGFTIAEAQRWLQRDTHLHLDLFGSPFRRAIAKCENAPGAPAATMPWNGGAS